MPPQRELNYEDVRLVAVRVAGFAFSILEAHSLGHGPGLIDDLCSREFHERAIEIYPLTLPWPYLTALGTRFVATSRFMTKAGSPPLVAEEWCVVSDYIRCAGETMLIYTPTPPTLEEEMDLAPRTPAVVRFDLLARVASSEGAHQLENAGKAVGNSLAQKHGGQLSHTNPLTGDEVDLLRRLAAGEKVADLSSEFGHSDRTLYRKLKSIWERIGVDSRSEGIATAATHGWLTDDATS